MKKLIILIVLLCAALSFATDRGDLKYTQKGQAIQSEAPNYFENFSDAATRHTFDLDAYGGTLYWSLYNPSSTTCKYSVTTTSSTTGAVWQTIPGGSRDGLVKGYGMGYLHYSSCNLGEYRSGRGDWAGQQ